MILVGVVTYMTASMFLGLFQTAVISLLTCLAIDIDNNGEPVNGPPTFHDEKLAKINNAKTDVGNEMMEGGEFSG